MPNKHEVREPRYRPGDGPSIELATAPLLPPFVSGQEISALEVVWGNLKNCWLAGSLAAMANTLVGRAQIHRMVSFDESVEVVSLLPGGGSARSKGLVRVHFPSYAQPIPVSRLLYRFKHEPGAGVGDVYYAWSTKRHGWVSFIEKAYIALHETQARQQKAPASNLRTGYEVLEERLDETTIWRSLLLGPNGSPRVYKIQPRVDRQTMLSKLQNATKFPTTATTPPVSAGDRSLSTKSGLWRDHVYAVLGVKLSRSKTGRAVATVSLLGDGEQGSDELPIDAFLAEMDHVTQCEIRRPSLPP